MMYRSCVPTTDVPLHPSPNSTPTSPAGATIISTTIAVQLDSYIVYKRYVVSERLLFIKRAPPLKSFSIFNASHSPTHTYRQCIYIYRYRYTLYLCIFTPTTTKQPGKQPSSAKGLVEQITSLSQQEPGTRTGDPLVRTR